MLNQVYFKCIIECTTIVLNKPISSNNIMLYNKLRKVITIWRNHALRGLQEFYPETIIEINVKSWDTPPAPSPHTARYQPSEEFLWWGYLYRDIHFYFCNENFDFGPKIRICYKILHFNLSQTSERQNKSTKRTILASVPRTN